MKATFSYAKTLSKVSCPWFPLTCHLLILSIAMISMKHTHNAQLSIAVLFGGIEYSPYIGVNYLAYSRWLMLLTAPILANCMLIQNAQKSYIFSAIRLRSPRIWWRGVCIASICQCLQYSIGALFLWLILDKSSFQQQGYSIGLFTLHTSLLTIIATWFFCNFKNGLLPLVITLVVECVSFSLAQHYSNISIVMPGVWSMYYQSAAYIDNGFSIPLCIGIQILFLGFFYTNCPRDYKV